MEIITCSHLGCSSEGVVACPHGQWCGEHILAHQGVDNDCRIQIAEALRVWTVKVSIPLIARLKALRPLTLFEGLPLEEVEREVFPIQLRHLELVKTCAGSCQSTFELLERVREMLEEHLNDILQVSRGQYEGAGMPFGLDDQGVLDWLGERIQSQKSSLLEH
jgi:hypothetical protein